MNPARSAVAPCRGCGALVIHALVAEPMERHLRLEPQTSLDGEFLVWWEETEPAGKRVQKARPVVAWERAEGRPYTGPRHRAHVGELCPGAAKARRRGISPGTGGAGCL